MKLFLKYAIGTLFSPKTTFDDLLKRPFPMKYGLFSVFLVGIIYSISVIIGYYNGFGAAVKPFLPISAKDYYFFEAFFTLPVFITATLIFAAAIQVLSVLVRGTGKFEECIAVFGLSLWITIIPLMWIPETLTMVFFPDMKTGKFYGTLGLPPVLDAIRQIITLIWQTIVTFIGIKIIHKFSWLKTIIVGLLGLVVFLMFFLTYIR